MMYDVRCTMSHVPDAISFHYNHIGAPNTKLQCVSVFDGEIWISLYSLGRSFRSFVTYIGLIGPVGGLVLVICWIAIGSHWAYLSIVQLYQVLGFWCGHDFSRRHQGVCGPFCAIWKHSMKDNKKERGFCKHGTSPKSRLHQNLIT